MAFNEEVIRAFKQWQLSENAIPVCPLTDGHGEWHQTGFLDDTKQGHLAYYPSLLLLQTTLTPFVRQQNKVEG